MIARSHRFHGYGSVRRVYKAGRAVRGPLMGLKFSERGAHKPYRVAVVVSRKVHKSAVTRNRIRRRVYEVVRQSGQPPRPGTDLIITVFSDQVATLSSDELKQAVTDLLNKTNRF
jgi:ribonuclease P protein component